MTHVSLALAGPDASRPATPQPAPVSVPAWAIGAKWYVVDVASFANGDRSNDPPGTVAWPVGPPSDATARDQASTTVPIQYGGDLAGLARRLPYLTDLGVDTLQLTGLSLPLKTPGEGRLADFLKKAHRSGMRVVVATPADPTELVAVTRQWMDPNGDGRFDDGVDGWVATWPGELSTDAWRRWRGQVKGLNPQALIVADVQGDTRAALASGLFDTLIDYSTGRAIVEFFRDPKAGVAPRKFIEELVIARKGMSLASRLASPIVLGGSDRGTDGRARAAWRLVLVFQHFFAGSPLTYYGDEIGLRGASGRRAMLWPDLPGTDPAVKTYRDDLASLLQWLHARRDVDGPLRRGAFRPILADGDRRVLAFARATKEGEVILLMNYGPAKRKVMLPAGEPGMKVNVLTPVLDPGRKLPQFGRKAARSSDRITPRRMAASHQILNHEGLARLWVDPMSIRVVLSSKP